MSFWEKQWRKNLRLFTVDEIPQSQQLLVSRWLKNRLKLLLSGSFALEAQALIQEFDNLEEELS